LRTPRGTFVGSLVTGHAVVLKKLKMWKVYDERIPETIPSEKLKWAPGSGELQKNFSLDSHIYMYIVHIKISSSCHDIHVAEILLKLTLNTNQLISFSKMFGW